MEGPILQSDLSPARFLFFNMGFSLLLLFLDENSSLPRNGINELPKLSIPAGLFGAMKREALHAS